MKKSYTSLRYIVSYLMAVFLVLGPGAAFTFAETADASSNELLVKYAELPKSIAASVPLPETVEQVETLTPSVELLSFPHDADVKLVAEKLEKNPFIKTVEPNHERSVSVTNDVFYTNQWWLPHVQAEQLWPLAAKQKKQAVVAVIDSGIDTTHEDLVGRIAPGGFNFIDQTQNIQDVNGHGTSVAGIIAANSNNRKGIAGVTGSYGVSILPLKTVHDDGKSTVADNLRAIDYAIQQGVDVINISQGGTSPSTIEQDAIRRAVRAGIPIIASAGNDALKGNPTMYPAAYDEVISVGSVNQRNSRSDFSNYNNQVDIVAPGEQIYTTGISNHYVIANGTSFSAPIVAGTVAMMKAIVPELSVKEITEVLTKTAKDLGQAGKDAEYGFGLLNSKQVKAELEQLLIQKQTVPVTGISLNQTMIRLLAGEDGDAGEQTVLTATITPSNATDRNVVWTSSRPTVASVSQSGMVTAVSKGEAIITAETVDGKYKATAKVIVDAPKPFVGTFADLTVNTSKQFVVKFNKPLAEGMNYKKHIQISKRADGQQPITTFNVTFNPAVPDQLIIAPQSRWELGTYYLNIRQGVQAKDGKLLTENVNMRFIVR
ncbi:S8 family peptidase [Sporosarcina aquimarina]|uniref:S8 family peptidase n=1 Tax=Sporosarcina aquimarina TaxID=114975 RepID=UPI001C8EDF10|nr:S8 family serine peptidase [Sporosarcina aquimarina]